MRRAQENTVQRAQTAQSKFGFTRSDVVGWTQEDPDLPKGREGIVIGFDDDCINVSFRAGMFGFRPQDLFLIGEEKFSFRTGDVVLWNQEDADVPRGTRGTVMGFTPDRIVVNFRGSLFQFRAGDLNKAGEEKAAKWTPRGYMEAAGVGLDAGDESTTASRNDSGNSGLGNSHSSGETRRGSNSQASEGGRARSEVGLSEYGSNMGDDARSDVAGDRLLSLLKASPPMPIGSITGRYCVNVHRSSQRQPFGVAMQTTQSEGSVEIISVAEDLPHLGIRRSDEVISVNGKRPKSIAECCDLMSQSMSVALVLQHQEPGKRGSARRGSSGSSSPRASGGASFWLCGDYDEPPSSCPSAPLRSMLSTTRPTVMDEGRGVFTLRVQRASLKQKFGIGFTAEQPRRRGGQAMIVVSETLPHMGLEQGDQLLNINGVTPVSGNECRRILDRSMNIRLKLRRRQLGSDGKEITGGLRLVMDYAPIDDYVGQMDVEVDEVPLSGSLPCFARGWGGVL